jgi:hypothetical protein
MVVFLTLLLHRCNISIYLHCNKNWCPNLIWRCCPNVLPNKLKNQMINYGVQICNPMEIDVIMNIVDQNNEIIEHITFKRGLHVIEHVVHISFTYLHYCYEITYKKSFNCETYSKNVLLLITPSLHSSLVTKFPHQ